MLEAGPQRIDQGWGMFSAERRFASDAMHPGCAGRVDWAWGGCSLWPGSTASAAPGWLRGHFFSPAFPLSRDGASMVKEGVICEAQRPERGAVSSLNSGGKEQEGRHAYRAEEVAVSGKISRSAEKPKPVYAERAVGRSALVALRIGSSEWDQLRLPRAATLGAMVSKTHSGRADSNGQARRVLGWLAAILLLSCGAGCGPADDRVAVYPVSGQVRLNGQPLANALVVFHPQNPADTRTPVAQGRTDDSGKFQLTSYETRDGAAAGEFAVTVQSFQLIKQGDSYTPGPNILPAKLAKPDSTDIRVTIGPQPNELAPIDLKK